MSTSITSNNNTSNNNHIAVSPSVLPQKVKFQKNLIYGGIAGFIGSLTTFPIDLSKTRLQEQTKTNINININNNIKQNTFIGGPYNGIFHCLKTMIKNEGILSIYKGLPVQLIGIIPEKALKLSANDYFRYSFKNIDGTISLRNEAIAGALAGLVQVIVTSPMEMIKIRMQLQSKKPVADRQSLGQVLKTLFAGGPKSIYRGALSTISRDIPFTALYFPAFSNLKLLMARQDQNSTFGIFRKKNSDHLRDVADRVNLLGTFIGGLVVGSFCAVAVTPMDVVKTRLQSEGGVEKYKNIRTCIKMTYAENGIPSFFKGATGRFMLIGPLFGVVLMTYEFMPKFIPL